MHNRRAEALRECHGPVTIIYDKRHATYENDVACLQENWFRNQAGKTARASSPQLSRILVGTNLYGLQVGAIGSLSEPEHEDILLSLTEIQPAFGQEEVALVQLWASARSGKSRLAGLPLTLTETISRVYILNNR